MKKKELIKISLKAYENALNEIKTKKMNFNTTHRFLDKKNLELGVCNFLQRNTKDFNDDSPSNKWIKNYYKTNSYGENWDVEPKYWAKIPYTCTNRKDIVSSLLIRRDILKKELKTCK